MTTTAPPAPGRTEATGAPSPPDARRSRPPGWRNPRLVLGVLLVAAAVVAGSRVVAAADDSVAVWVAATDLPAGATVGPDDLERRDVRFPDDATARGYLSASTALPGGSTVDRPVAAGELLPRGALAPTGAEALVEVPVRVQLDDLPVTVRQGSVVDVWVAPDPAAGSPSGSDGQAELVLPEVEVVAVAGDADGLSPEGSRQMIVGVPEDRSGELGRALGLLASGRVVVARTG